ncbi:MAG: hypothetical protein ACE5HL_00370 [Terriglobia bacterium]
MELKNSLGVYTEFFRAKLARKLISWLENGDVWVLVDGRVFYLGRASTREELARIVRFYL